MTAYVLFFIAFFALVLMMGVLIWRSQGTPLPVARQITAIPASSGRLAQSTYELDPPLGNVSHVLVSTHQRVDGTFRTRVYVLTVSPDGWSVVMNPDRDLLVTISGRDHGAALSAIGYPAQRGDVE